jgi:hypothetical protein
MCVLEQVHWCCRRQQAQYAQKSAAVSPDHLSQEILMKRLLPQRQRYTLRSLGWRRSLSLPYAWVVVLLVMAGNLSAQIPAQVTVDASVVPFQESLPDAGYGVRHLAAVRDKAHLMTFVADEVLFTPKDPSDLTAFLKRYGGKVVNNGSVPAPPPELAPHVAARGALKSKPPVTYTVQLNPSSFDPAAIAKDAHAQGLAIEALRFGTNPGARLFALVLHERAAGSAISLNFVGQAHQYLATVPKSPDPSSKKIDAMQWLVFHDDTFGTGNAAQKCTDGNFTWNCNFPSTGSNVYMAWRFVADDAPAYRPRVAIIDGGFWLDASGNSVKDPNGGNPLPPHPAQYNFINNSYIAFGVSQFSCGGGSACPYHGTGTSNVALASLAYPSDGAGTGGQVADPILLYSDLTSDHMGLAVQTAVDWGADIISISSAFDGCSLGVLLCGEKSYADAIDYAHSNGRLVVASAGNNGQDATNTFPCNYGPVLCVGALGDGQSRPRVGKNSNDWSSNYGNSVKIWAPSNIPAITPGATGLYGFGDFGGTSASAPFVAGIAAMVKAVGGPSLTDDSIKNILIGTARGGNLFGDNVLDMRAGGIHVLRVDAYAAVMQAAGGYHLRPTLTISSPQNGATVHIDPVKCSAEFSAKAADVQDGLWPLKTYGNPGPTPIFVASDVKPLTGVFAKDCGLGFSPGEGLQHITATVTNSHGISASATAAVTFKYDHNTPSPVITWPPPNTTVPAGIYKVTGYAKSTDPGIFGNFDCKRLVFNGNIPAVPVPNSNELCQAQVTFNAPAQVVTLTATDIFGDKGTASTKVNVTGQTAGKLSVQILNPLNGAQLRISNSSTPIGLQGNASPLMMNSKASYTWWWYYTAKGPGTHKQIASGVSPASTWSAQTSGLCQTSTPQDVTIELDVYDVAAKNVETAYGSATSRFTVTCQTIQ